MQVNKQQLKLNMEYQTGSKLGKEYVKVVYCHPAYFTYMQSTSCKMPSWMKHKMESRLPGNVSNLRYADDTTFMAESEEELKSLLMKMKENEKAGLKLNIQKMKILASGPITSRQIGGETLKTVTNFLSLGSKSTADGDWRLAIERCLLLRIKAMANLDGILKSRDITLATKVHLVKAMIFPVVTYGCKTWIVKKAERRRIDAFELWCWRRLLRVPWTARKSNQSILKEVSPEYSLEGLMLKLKLQYSGHLMWRTDSLEKTLMLGKIEGRRRRGQQRMRLVGWHHQLDGHEFEPASGFGDGQGSLVCCSPWCCKDLDRTEQRNWTETNFVGLVNKLDLGTHFWNETCLYVGDLLYIF